MIKRHTPHTLKSSSNTHDLLPKLKDVKMHFQIKEVSHAESDLSPLVRSGNGMQALVTFEYFMFSPAIFVLWGLSATDKQTPNK